MNPRFNPYRTEFTEEEWLAVMSAFEDEQRDDCSLSGRGWIAAVCIGAAMWAGIGGFVWLVW